MAESEKIGLTIFLLKQEQVATFEKEVLSARPGSIPLAPPLEGTFLAIPAAVREPNWLPAIRSLVGTNTPIVLHGQSPAALLVVQRGGRTFVLTFGHAWQLLKDEWLETDFGRRIALNSIARDQVVEIRAEQVFARWHLASERAPRASSVEDFGVEFDRDLVASVEGIPSKSESVLGASIRGSTNLRINIPISELATVLDKSTILFGSDAYKKAWPEIDNVSPVKDQNLIAHLEGELDKELATEEGLRKIVLFTPMHKRSEMLPIESYVFGRMSKLPTKRPYLMIGSWLSFLEQKRLSPSVEEAKNSPIHLLDDAQEEIKTCTAFECFCCEMTVDGRQYILSSGIWYEVVADFVLRINTAIKQIAKPTIVFPKWDGTESEGEYNLRCSNRDGFLNFDAKNIHYGGGQSQFEFCDLLDLRSKTLIFAKIVSKSTGMSHLVEQARRTSELLFSTDGEYRKQLTQVFKQHHPHTSAEWLKTRPRNGDWHFCLLSLGRAAVKLPFFAKCGLVKLCKDLSERGYSVSFGSV